MVDPRKVLMNGLTSWEHFQKVLPENDILCAELSDIGFLRVHHLQLYISRKFLPKKEFEKGREKRMDPRGECRGELTLVISLCVFWASSSALCWQEGSNRAKSAKSLSKDSLAAKSNLITSCWTSFACWILVAEPTHLVVVSYNDYENFSFDVYFFLFFPSFPLPSPPSPPFSRVCACVCTTSEIDWDRLNEAKLV